MRVNHGSISIGLLCLLVLSGTFSLWSQEKAGASKLDLTQQYLVLSTIRTATLQRELNEAAAAGYRVLGGCDTGQRVVLLEKVASSPDLYSYTLLATQRTGTMQKELNEAGAKGFRVLPQAITGGHNEIIVILEKAPGPLTPVQYRLLATKLTGTLQKEMTQAAIQGYAVVGLVSRNEHMVIVEKTAAAGAPGDSKPGGLYQLLATKRTSTMQEELNKAKAAGFRVLASSPTSGTEVVMLMEKAGQQTGEPDYRLLATSLFKTLEKELNETAAQGYRLIRQSVGFKLGYSGSGDGMFGMIRSLSSAGDETVAVMEKQTDNQKRYDYRLLRFFRDSPEFQQKITASVQEGYKFAAMTGDNELKGPSTGGIVILEKELP